MHEKLEQLRETLLRRFRDNTYTDADQIQGWDLKITQDKTTVRITACRMYDYLPINFETMKMISEILGTDKIEDVKRHCAIPTTEKKLISFLNRN
jgi:hypothetical protein